MGNPHYENTKRLTKVDLSNIYLNDFDPYFSKSNWHDFIVKYKDIIFLDDICVGADTKDKLRHKTMNILNMER